MQFNTSLLLAGDNIVTCSLARVRWMAASPGANWVVRGTERHDATETRQSCVQNGIPSSVARLIFGAARNENASTLGFHEIVANVLDEVEKWRPFNRLVVLVSATACMSVAFRQRSHEITCQRPPTLKHVLSSTACCRLAF
eukprot:5252869-Amphidinium_carterae.2